jgi:thiol-disulfide isomerase/thioredoxin
MRWTPVAGLLLGVTAACRPASGGFTLLFLARSPAASLGGLSWAPDPDHSRVVAFDGGLRPVRALTGPRLASPMAVAPLGDGLLVSERTGEAVLLDTAGHALREWDSPAAFAAAIYSAAGRDGGARIVAARSPYYLPQFRAEADTAPLLEVLDTLGRPVAGLATVHVPEATFLTGFVNAGPVAVAPAPQGDIYFAPLTRDEIRKYGPGGELRWTAKRGLFRSEPDPEYLPSRAGGRDGEIRIKRAFVNVALALGPDGRLYVLGAADSNATALRLDVLDTATGRIVATQDLGTAPLAVAVDRGGRVRTAPADSLLALLVERPREAFVPAFALPGLAGDTVTLARFAGKVTLVNFWASWCDPCRDEFPHMAELYRAFGRRDFEIAAISDDVDQTKMRRFVREFRPPFPILVGAGRMRAVYHYRGLPYSVLLDRRGRIVERIFGFGGAGEFADLRATIAKEIAAP